MTYFNLCYKRKPADLPTDADWLFTANLYNIQYTYL